jgi:uncharacterized repeat protein (TIGR04052 family)
MRPALTLILTAMLAACSGQDTPIEIEFGAVYREDPVACGEIASRATLTDLRFYAYALELRAADGKWQRIRLDDDTAWQQADLALIDLEDGTSKCLNGTTETRRIATGTVAPGDYEGVRFTLGVPFDRNHEDPLQAAAPLDDSAMHWHWRSGYKFLRAGLATQEDGFWIHLGSTGCEGRVGNITSCSSPNRIVVQLDEFVPGRDRIVFDFAALIDGTDLGDGAGSDCSSSPAEESCRSPFSALGIDFDSGRIEATQRVFKVAAL